MLHSYKILKCKLSKVTGSDSKLEAYNYGSHIMIQA